MESGYHVRIPVFFYCNFVLFTRYWNVYEQ